MRALASQALIADNVMTWALRLIKATHPEDADAAETARQYLRMGASPRAAQALVTAAKARALARGAYNVSYDDLRALAFPVLRHRIRLNYAAVAEGKTPDELIERIVEEMDGQKGRPGRKPL